MRLSTAFSLLSHLLAISIITVPTAHARQTPTSYCKCICFTNSTIIPLNSPPTRSKSSQRDLHEHQVTANVLHREPALLDDDLSFTNVFTRSPDDDDDNNDKPSAGDNDGANNGDGKDDGKGEDGDDKTHHRQLTCNDCNRAFCLDYNLPICKGAKEEEVFTSCFQRDSVKDETVVFIFIFLTVGLLSWALAKPWIDRARDSGAIAAYSPLNLRGGTRGVGNGRTVLPRTEYLDDAVEEGVGARGEGGSGTNRNRNRNGAGNVDGRIARQGGLNS